MKSFKNLIPAAAALLISLSPAKADPGDWGIVRNKLDFTIAYQVGVKDASGQVAWQTFRLAPGEMHTWAWMGQPALLRYPNRVGGDFAQISPLPMKAGGFVSAFMRFNEMIFMDCSGGAGADLAPGYGAPGNTAAPVEPPHQGGGVILDPPAPAPTVGPAIEVIAPPPAPPARVLLQTITTQITWQRQDPSTGALETTTTQGTTYVYQDGYDYSGVVSTGDPGMTGQGWVSLGFQVTD